MTRVDTVTLRGMRFHTHIGVLPHEAEIAQSIEVDLSVNVRRSDAPPSGGNVLDYRELYGLVATVIASGHIHYLEQLAERVTTDALRLREVVSARVAVRKPHVALPGPLAYAEVVVERSRDA